MTGPPRRALLISLITLTTVALGVPASAARAVTHVDPTHLRAATSRPPVHDRRPAGPAGSSVTFTPGTGYNSGSTPQSVVLGSVSGHASPDIVTANGSGDSVSALLNKADGSGQFSQPATVSSAGTGVAVSQVALGDFNGGGNLDAAVVSGTSTVSVMLGDGKGGFGPATTVGTLPNGQLADNVKVADLTGNGTLDIIVEGTQPNACYGNGESATAVLLGNGDGTFQSPVEYPTGDCGTGFGNYGSTDTGLAVADLTGNGHPDIVVTSHSTDTGSDVGRVFVLLNQGNGTFGSPAYVGGAPGIYGVAVADLNGDGHPDLAVGEAPITGTQRGISIFYGNGDGTFQSPVYIADPALTDGTNTAGQVTGIAIADMNGDGIPDIVTADSASLNGGPGGISVYLNGGVSDVNAPTFIPAPSTFAPQGLALGDVNSDGKPDVVLEDNQPVDQNHPANVLVMLSTVPSYNYLVELSAWIPQGWVVDPLNPGAKQPCDVHGCTQNGPQNPALSHCASGTLWESVFAGDKHNGFNGTLNSGADRGEVWTSFATSGNTFTNVGQQVVLGTTHRYEKFNGGSSYCVEAKQSSDSGGVAINSGATKLRLILATANPLVPASPDIHAVVYITANNGTLTFSYKTTFFPSIGIRVTRGSVRDTDIVNDADCLSQGNVLGLSGAATILLGLETFANNGTLTVKSHSESGTADHKDALLC